MTPSASSPHDTLVIGGSRGSLEPLRRLISALPAGLGAAVFVVQHRAAHSTTLETLLATDCALPVRRPVDGEPSQLGTIYVAGPDRHLLLLDGKVRSMFGPRENLTRPSIDVLFRSAAVVAGAGVVGVILSGALSDGAAGLAAVRRCGGVTVVQDPADAFDPELPTSALAGGADHRVSSANLGAVVRELVLAPRAAPVPIPADLEMEASAALAAMTDPEALMEVGEHTVMTCPECQGPIRLLRAPIGGTDRYRCHIGHSYTADALIGEQGVQLERALWIAYRTLLERAHMLQGLARQALDGRRSSLVETYEKRRRETLEHADAVRRTLEVVQASASPDLSDTKGGTEQ